MTTHARQYYSIYKYLKQLSEKLRKMTLKIWQIFRRAGEVKALNMSVSRISGIPTAAESGIVLSAG